MSGDLKIGELAGRAGVTVKAIRFYERKRVLPPAKPAANRYRLYDDDAVGMLYFVKQATGLGLTLVEIKEIIAIRRGGRPPCPHVHRLLRDKALEFDRKLKDLLELRRRIRQSLTAWERRPIAASAVCPHIETPAARGRKKVVMAAARVETRMDGPLPGMRGADRNGDEVNGGLKIGQLARQVGVTAKAIRFYEAKRVLPRPTRGANGYRLYGQDAVETLTFVKQAAALGLTLGEIREIIAIRQGGGPPCMHVRRLLQDKAPELDAKHRDLIEMRRLIRLSLAAWSRAGRGRAAVCPHIEAASRGERNAPPSSERKPDRGGLVMKQVELRVNGMTCGACEQRIQRALAQVDGVVRSAADHRAARVKVVFDPARTSAQAVQARITQVGYEVASPGPGPASRGARHGWILSSSGARAGDEGVERCRAGGHMDHRRFRRLRGVLAGPALPADGVPVDPPRHPQPTRADRIRRLGGPRRRRPRAHPAAAGLPDRTVLRGQ